MSKAVLILGSYAESLIQFRGPLMQAMATAGHRVTAAVPQAPEPIREALARLGVSYHALTLDAQGVNPLADLGLVRRLRRLMRDLQPDVVLAYTIKPVIYGSLAARLAGVPGRFALITGVGYAFANEDTRARFVRAVAGWLYRLSLAGNDKVFFQNTDDRDLFLQLGLLRRPDQAIVVNGSGVDLRHYAVVPLPAELSFLFLGRPLRDKGVREYVEAARMLKVNHPKLRFRLAGWFDNNPMAVPRDELEGWAKEGVIEYLGHLADVRPAIAGSSVYVLPSYREGTPRTVLEAMAMGRPIVTTDAPGCRETVVPGRNGFLVAVKDVQALASAMARFVEEPALIARMGAESRRIAETKYDVHKVNAVLLEGMGL